MKKIISIILAAMPGLLFAQSAERQVIGSAGGWASTATVQVSSTGGEAVITTGTSATVILTQGFQQNDGGPVGIEDVKTGLSINAFPNPSKGLVTLQLNAPNALEVTLQVFDISGKLTSLPVQKLQASGETTLHIDFSSMAAGNYYVKLSDKEGSLHQTIKVQKVD